MDFFVVFSVVPAAFLAVAIVTEILAGTGNCFGADDSAVSDGDRAAAVKTVTDAANKPSVASGPPAAALIASLGDESYLARRGAEVDLLARGEAVRNDLAQAATEHLDPEVRHRSRRLLLALDAVRAKAYRDALEGRLATFVEDDHAASKDYDFPGWKAFRTSVGSERHARELFAHMQRNEPELLAKCEGPPEELSKALAARCLAIMQSMSHPLPSFRTPITPGRAAALYFAAANKDITLDAKAATQLYSMANQATIRTALADADESGPLKKVIGNWIALDQPGDRNLGYYKVLLAMQHDMKEGREAGLNMIKDDKAAATSYQYLQALLAVAKYGSEKDIDTIEPLLKNNTVCQTSTVSAGAERKTYTTQVRDVALATLVQLSGQEHREYGFDRLQKHPKSMFQTHTLGFEQNDEKGREEALAKWQRWKAGREKKK